MNIGELRDLIIIIWGTIGIIAGVIGIIALTVVTILLFAFYRRMKTLTDTLKVTLGKIDAIASRVQEISNYAGNEVLKPLIRIAAVIRSASHGFRIIERIFQRGENDGQ
jgi:hypothetical protein